MCLSYVFSGGEIVEMFNLQIVNLPNTKKLLIKVIAKIEYKNFLGQEKKINSVCHLQNHRGLNLPANLYIWLPAEILCQGY